MKSSNFTLTPFGYYIDFVSVPIMVAAAAWYAWPLDPVTFFNSFVAGVGLWTIAEYWIHKWVFHRPRLKLQTEHALHHRDPIAYIGASPWLTVFIGFLIAGFGSQLLGTQVGIGLFVGLLTGYLCYVGLHTLYHHGRPRGALRQLYLNHEWHHRRPRVNFGVTSPLWDVVFGTYQRGTERGAR